MLRFPTHRQLFGMARTLHFLFALVLSPAASASDVSVFLGEWEQLESGWEPKYTFFRMNADRSGVLATVRGDGEPHVDHFEPEQVTRHGEIAHIHFEEGDLKAVLVLSGYRNESGPKSGLLTGALYMFEQADTDWRLFNTIFVRLLQAEDPSFFTTAEELRNKVSAAESDDPIKGSLP